MISRHINSHDEAVERSGFCSSCKIAGTAFFKDKGTRSKRNRKALLPFLLYYDVLSTTENPKLKKEKRNMKIHVKNAIGGRVVSRAKPSVPMLGKDDLR